MSKLTEADARALAGRAGVTLDDEAARQASQAMEQPLALADAAVRALPFEAEPTHFLLAQRRGTV